MYQLVLASNSPRRKEILKQVGMQFEVCPSEVDEVITKIKPAEVVLELSLQKANDVADRLKEQSPIEGTVLVIGADTVVAMDEQILGKPKNIEDASNMLSMLQGNTHSVFTGVSLVFLTKEGQRTVQFYEETKVEVFPMSKEEITAYLSHNEYQDKAGAYGIQGMFGAYIKGIQGDYYNVVGFPVARFLQVLKDQGETVLL